MALIERSTHLAASPGHVWQELGTPRLLQYVAHPVIRFQPVDPPAFPPSWAEGEYRVSLRLFGRLPLGSQVIRIARPQPEGPCRVVRDTGGGSLARRWDHVMEVCAEGSGTRYTDRVEVDAGPLTWLVAAFASHFFQHRQRRWRRLVAHDLDYSL